MTALVPFDAPLVAATPDQLRDFTEAWLANRRFTPNTQTAYRRDVTDYLTWCQHAGLDPLAARFTHLNRYGRALETEPQPRTGRPAAPSTVARKMSAVASWYDFLVRLGALPLNPAAAADRPAVDRSQSTTVGLTAAEAAALTAAATNDRYLGDRCATALAQFMVDIGARVSEACAADIADLGHESGYRTIMLTKMKGGKRRKRSMPPPLAEAVDAMLAERADILGVPVADLAGPLFTDRSGDRLNRHEVYRFLRRAARAAGIPSADRITPHSFRHAWNTIARKAGASLEHRQHALGHADPRTTQGYDRDQMSVESDPSHLVAAALAAARAEANANG